LAWTIEFDPEVRKDLRRLGRQSAKRIVDILERRIATLDDPRLLGSSLVGEWAGYWRYRVGDYRIIARLEHERLVIFVVRIGHRREVYD